MKKTLVSLFFCMAIFMSCSDIDSDNGKADLNAFSSLTNSLTRSQNEVANGQLNFGLNFFKRAYSSGCDNLLVSPFSVAVELSMLTAGTTGNAYDELNRALGFNDFSQEQIYDFYNVASSRLTEFSDGAFSIANAIWINADGDFDKTIKDDFKQIVNDSYQAEIAALVFNNKAVSLINEWAKNKTKGKIEKVIEMLAPTDKVVLNNAINFDGRWNYVYSVSNGTFTSEKGKKIEKPFFGGDDPFIHMWNLNNKLSKEPSIVGIPFSGNYTMYFFLPPEKQSLDDFINSIDADRWVRWISQTYCKETKSRIVSFRIPFFDSGESDKLVDCKSLLKSMGVSEIFNDPDFSPMTSSDLPLKVTSISQNNRISVNEKGCNAASVSTVVIGMEISNYNQSEPERYSFIADRPFVYAIVENTTQTILFMGTVTE